MNKRKIINDPVYGFIHIPYDLVFDLIEHPWFQRLRRINQLGMTHYVYPGAHHTRFHHALGAMHLMTQTIDVLRSKGVDISEAEAEGVTVAILLHDIGHGPFSHALEHTLMPQHHESISLLMMERLNKQSSGALSLAIEIFKGEYSKQFLHQLVSSQLDMDRMDYLNRDSFYTGVAEGKIGYDRLIKMLDVVNDELVVEEKGIYSIEKFLIARRLMYWQVYLHKTVLSAEQMLIQTLTIAKQFASAGVALEVSRPLHYFLYNTHESGNLDDLIDQYTLLDDFDIVHFLKVSRERGPDLLRYFCDCLINRDLFKVDLRNEAFSDVDLEQIAQKVKQISRYRPDFEPYLMIRGSESNLQYDIRYNEIKVLRKDGSVLPFSEIADFPLQTVQKVKYFVCYPKN